MNFHKLNCRQKLVNSVCVMLLAGIICSAFPLMCVIKVSGIRADVMGLPVNDLQNNHSSGSEKDAAAEFITLLAHDALHAGTKNNTPALDSQTSAFLLPKVAIDIHLPPPKV